ADGFISVPTALISLYAGIAIGDTALYTLGALARNHPRLAHYIDHDFTAPFRSWLEHKYAFKVFSGHFVPGFRFTTFVASGFFRFPLRTYISMAIAGGVVLMAALFSVSYLFGSFSSKWVSEVRWGIAAVFLLVLFFIARHNIRAYKEQRNVLANVDNNGDTSNI
ncbi:MAG: VTT domain-containing protein, partial [Patescibacteria group bacterium]